VRKFIVGAAILTLILTAVACGDDDETDSVPTQSSGDTLTILKGVGESIPRFPNLTVDEEYIYTGGERTESIYWTHEPPNYVVHFYYEQFPPVGWDITAGPTWTTQPTSDKDSDTHETGTLTLSRGGFDVTITVVEDQEKDPQRGTTRVGIAIERTDPAATVPPILPTPSSAEGF
jgi:hypothetical protein